MTTVAKLRKEVDELQNRLQVKEPKYILLKVHKSLWVGGDVRVEGYVQMKPRRCQNPKCRSVNLNRVDELNPDYVCVDCGALIIGAKETDESQIVSRDGDWVTVKIHVKREVE